MSTWRITQGTGNYMVRHVIYASLQTSHPLDGDDGRPYSRAERTFLDD